MAEKPILCAAPVVRAILDGRQTQDRRPVKNPGGWLLANPDATRIGCYHVAPPHFFADRYVEAPYSPGDVLYVRETWAEVAADHGGGIVYAADYQPPGAGDYGLWRHCAEPATCFDGPWKPSIHMKKAHARLRLNVTTVRCERVNAISEEDARREGVADVAAFRVLWDGLYGAGSFDSGVWCWVTDFEVVR